MEPTEWKRTIFLYQKLDVIVHEIRKLAKLSFIFSDSHDKRIE